MASAKKGFTLIELLVVIAIIGLLLAIVLPGLRAAKRKAQSTVCMTNIRQWGMFYSLYANDYDGNFPEYIVPDHSFMESLRDYYDDINKIRTCPAANKISTANPTGLQPESYFGSTFNAWQIDPVAAWLDDEDWGIGSYTENSWIRKMSYPEKEWVKLTAVKVTSKVPLLLDGRWHDSHVESVVPPVPSPVEERAFYNLGNWSTIRTYVMRRHKKGINGVMVDMSTINIQAEDLWSYKWHKQFQSREVNLDWLKSDL